MPASRVVGPSCPVNWRVCVICEQRYVKPPNVNRRTCSRECERQTLELAAAADPGLPLCAYCTRPFEPGRSGRKYCTDYCAALSMLARNPMQKPDAEAIAAAVSRVERERSRSATFQARQEITRPEVVKHVPMNTHIPGSIAWAMLGGRIVKPFGQAQNVFSGGDGREARSAKPYTTK